ncbi:MAG: ABC transporter ATP-binding protein, partial [Planctomyces sp.]
MSAVGVLKRALTRQIDREDERQRPLDLGLIRRLFASTDPWRRQRFWLLVAVLARAVQLPALTGLVAAVIRGPIAAGDAGGIALGALAFAALAVSTQIVLHFRQKLALELGEAVVCDLRCRLFRHIQSMPMRWFHTNRSGRVVSRMTSDLEDVRAGVQDVFFVSLVQLVQMLIAAAAMLWYDSVLF